MKIKYISVLFALLSLALASVMSLAPAGAVQTVPSDTDQIRPRAAMSANARVVVPKYCSKGKQQTKYLVTSSRSGPAKAMVTMSLKYVDDHLRMRMCMRSTNKDVKIWTVRIKEYSLYVDWSQTTYPIKRVRSWGINYTDWPPHCGTAWRVTVKTADGARAVFRRVDDTRNCG